MRAPAIQRRKQFLDAALRSSEFAEEQEAVRAASAKWNSGITRFLKLGVEIDQQIAAGDQVELGKTAPSLMTIVACEKMPQSSRPTPSRTQ